MWQEWTLAHSDSSGVMGKLTDQDQIISSTASSWASKSLFPFLAHKCMRFNLFADPFVALFPCSKLLMLWFCRSCSLLKSCIQFHLCTFFVCYCSPSFWDFNMEVVICTDFLMLRGCSYDMLPLDEQLEIARQIGTTRAHVLSNLRDLALSTSFL